MNSLKVGHYTNLEQSTGLSVFLFNSPAVGAYHICGAAPATRELHTLDFESNVPEIHGLVLTGGSAFGLGAVDGVMRYLDEKGQGQRMPHGGVVPIVPAASIYDLAVTAAHAPSSEDAYQACLTAQENNTDTGMIGAGTGATVGKLIPETTRMSGGMGCAQLELPTGLKVTAYAVVNAVGDICDERGKIIAGARLADGTFVDSEKFLLLGGDENYASPSNTTLVALFTNAKLTKNELKRIAKMATAGLARAVSPVFTAYDGDVIFAISIGDQLASELTVGMLAVEATQRAIINSVKNSLSLHRYDA